MSTSTTLFDQTRAFDAVGNVTSTNTTLSVSGSPQTDNQAFCYDEQNRLVWAGSQGTPSCGGTLTAGTLNTGNVRYTQTYSYDTLNRLTTGPKGASYTYGDTNHLDALTAAPSYTASYDAAGDMTGRSGQVLSYNALRQLITWQNQATSPTQTASYAYNGSGERVQQSVTTSGTTTTTSYIGTYEEVSVTGGTTTTTKYYSAGLATVVNVNGTLSYLVNDTLGSVSASLTVSGGVGATELYTPYGSVRYSSGTMPTSYGYTKQRQDPSGLNYDHARYYDASVGQFISADSVQGPNRYGYVAGNPETNTDPTGQNICSDDAELCGNSHRHQPTPSSEPTPTKTDCSIHCGGGSTGSGGVTYSSPPIDPCKDIGGCPTPAPTKPTPKPTPSPTYRRCADYIAGTCAVAYGGIAGDDPGGFISIKDKGSRFLEGIGINGVAGLEKLLGEIKSQVDTIFEHIWGEDLGGCGIICYVFWPAAVLIVDALGTLHAEASFNNMIQTLITQLDSTNISSGEAIIISETNIQDITGDYVDGFVKGGNLQISYIGACDKSTNTFC